MKDQVNKSLRRQLPVTWPGLRVRKLGSIPTKPERESQSEARNLAHEAHSFYSGLSEVFKDRSEGNQKSLPMVTSVTGKP